MKSVMVVQELLDKLETSTKPVARVYFKSDQFKIIFIAFKAGMVLDQHTAAMQSRLMVLEGQVNYIQEGTTTLLNAHDYIDIPPHIIHEVHSLQDSLCMLTQGH